MITSHCSSLADGWWPAYNQDSRVHIFYWKNPFEKRLALHHHDWVTASDINNGRILLPMWYSKSHEAVVSIVWILQHSKLYYFFFKWLRIRGCVFSYLRTIRDKCHWRNWEPHQRHLTTEQAEDTLHKNTMTSGSHVNIPNMLTFWEQPWSSIIPSVDTYLKVNNCQVSIS